MRLSRNLIISVLAVLVVGFGSYFLWRSAKVQDLVLSKSSLVSLSERVGADPADWKAQYWYGRRLAETGQLAQAEVALRQALGSQPDYLPGLRELGKVQLGQNQVDEAYQLLRMVAGRDPSDIESRLALAVLYRNEGAYQRAIDELTGVLEQVPNHAKALYELGAAQALTQQYAKAEATLVRAQKLAPHDVDVLTGLSRIMLQQGKLDQAETFAREAYQRQPHNSNIVVALANTLSRKLPANVNREEALRLFREARKMDPARTDVTWSIAQILGAQGKWEEALPEIITAVRQNPHATPAYFLLSRAYRQLGRDADSKDAQKVFEKMSAYDRNVTALANKIAGNPNLPQLRFQLGEIHAAAHRTDLAIAAYKSGLQRSPNNRAARKRLAELIQRTVEK